MAETRRYCAYMLRGWLETTEDDPNPVWRFRVWDVRSSEELAFATVSEVVEFLRYELEGDDKENTAIKSEETRMK